MSKSPHIFLIRAAGRVHKLRPLLVDFQVTEIGGLGDMIWSSIKCRRPRSLVIIDSFGRWGIYGLLLSMLQRVPLVLRLRGDILAERRDWLKYDPSLLRRIKIVVSLFVIGMVLPRVRYFIFNSEYLQGRLSEFLGHPPQYIVNNPFTELSKLTPIDDLAVAMPKGRFHLLTVTNMNVAPKVSPMIEAVRDWMKPGHFEAMDMHWIVCGGGYMFPRLRAAIAEAGLSDRIHLMGQVSNIQDYYEWADVIIHLSTLDAFPNVPMEGFMYGCPTITNEDSCGTRDLVFDRETGRVIKDGNDFIEALVHYSEDISLRTKHALAGRKLVEERFSVARQKKNMNVAIKGFFRAEFADESDGNS